MLYQEAVDSRTLDLIRNLQSRDYLNGFHLVGETALALCLSHRHSIDIDLFSNFAWDSEVLLEQLQNDFGFQLYFAATNTLKGSIGNVKVDLLAHRYPLIEEPHLLNGMSLLSLPDIAAMKLNAIMTSGQRVKDFVDIWFLLQRFDLKQLLAFFRQKYSAASDTIVLKSLMWFEDVDLSEWPVFMVDPSPEWKTIKADLKKVVNRYLQTLA